MADYKVADTPFNIQGDDIYTSIRRADDTTTCFQSLTVMIKQIYFFSRYCRKQMHPRRHWSSRIYLQSTSCWLNSKGSKLIFMRRYFYSCFHTRLRFILNIPPGNIITKRFGPTLQQHWFNVSCLLGLYKRSLSGGH